jgi:LysR family transcriptional activator of dmlA
VLPDVTQPANLWAVYPARLAQSAKVRVCVDFLSEEFAQSSPPADGAAGAEMAER